MLNKSLFLGTAIAVCIAASPAIAEDDGSDEIVVTALRAIAPQDVTSSLTVLDQVDLDIRNSPYVVDQLRAVPGVGVSRSGAIGGITQVRIRGAEGNHTLVLLNGVEVSDPTTGETDFGLWSGLNTQRIEVVRGEQSVLYGSDAIGGVVAITTGGGGLNAAAEYGSFNTARGHVGLNKQIGGLTYGLNAAGFRTDGVDISGTGGAKDESESYSGSATAALELSPNVTLSGFTSYRRSEFDFDSFANTDQDNRTQADQYIVAASLDAQTGHFNHLLRTNYSRLNRQNFQADVFGNETIGQRTKFQYSPSVSFGTEDREVTVSGIADFESANYERVDTNTFFGDPNQNQTFDSYGIGGEARARLGNVALNGSVRHDDNDGRFENATTWRIGAAYNFGFGGKLRASAGTGVKNPTFTELFGFTPANFIGNPDLVPERSDSWEIGYDHTFGNFEGSVTYFDAALEDEIIFNNFFNGVINDDDDSERSGIEGSFGWQVTNALNVSAAASKITSKNADNIDEIRVPDWTASLAVNWQSQKIEGFRVGAALDYVGEQLDIDFNTFDPVTFQSPTVALSDYVLLSATAEYPISNRLSVTLRGENLLDETATDVFGTNQTGAGIFAGFKIK